WGVWQVLPLGPTGYGNSPYGCLSSFGGNPLLVSPGRLIEEGLLLREALDGVPRFSEVEVDFESVTRWKEKVLRASWDRFRASASPELRRGLEEFVASPQQAVWLADWALFSALKAKHGGREWTAWDGSLARREPRALEAARRELKEE